MSEGEVVGRKTRDLKGNVGLVVSIIAISMSIFQIWVNSVGVIPGIYRNAIHLGFLLILCFLLYPAKKRSPLDRVGISDVILAGLGASIAIYIVI